MDADRSQRTLLRAHQLIEATRERIERSSSLLLELEGRAEGDPDERAHRVSAIMLRRPSPSEAGNLLPGV